MSKDKYVAYVGTYTHENSIGIHLYDLDAGDGTMVERKVIPINNASYLVVSNSGKYLYSIADEGVQSFRILEDGDLEPINKAWIGGMRGCFVDVSKDDRFLLVGGYHDARVTVMKLNPEDGSIVGIADGVFHKGMGRCIAERSSRPHVNCVRLTPDQKYLCAVDGGLDQVKLYHISDDTGEIHNTDILRCQIDSAPKSMRFSDDGRFAYVLCELLNCVNVYRYEVRNGEPEFEFLQEITTTDPKDDDICSATAMTITPDGKHLYVVNAGVNSAVIYDIDQETGMLTLNCNNKISGEFPKAVRVFPDNEHFMTLNHENNEICVFKMNYEDHYFLMQGKPLHVDKPN
ncbi:MAG: beta-propeller fold lactonase family protein, partial [Lachnospiraceae bacterium]|nr:beta-propeller fold lactonase family protein [bacterium]MDY5517479.1 beta-propeller fold lactonase family protein [Lachnospiraceae bacterium]